MTPRRRFCVASQAVGYHPQRRGLQCVDQRIDIRFGGAVIDDRGANDRATLDHGGRWRRRAALVKIADDRLDQVFIIEHAQGEAHDIERYRGPQLKHVGTCQSRLEIFHKSETLTLAHTDKIESAVFGRSPSRQTKRRATQCQSAQPCDAVLAPHQRFHDP